MSQSQFKTAIDQALKKQLTEYKTILSQSKGQVIFYGPPGTGKTYIAKALANLISPGPTKWENTSHRKIVQCSLMQGTKIGARLLISF